MCLRWSASRHCCLRESSSAQWCHCTHRLTRIWVQWHCWEEDDSRRKQQRDADRRRQEWGCAYVIQPLAALVPWLISSSSLHFYFMITHARRCRFYSWTLQTKPRFELHNARFPLSNHGIYMMSHRGCNNVAPRYVYVSCTCNHNGNRGTCAPPASPLKLPVLIVSRKREWWGDKNIVQRK